MRLLPLFLQKIIKNVSFLFSLRHRRGKKIIIAETILPRFLSLPNNAFHQTASDKQNLLQ